MLSTQPNPLFSVAEIGVLNCARCSKPMRLASIEPDKPGFDLRAFECPKCNSGKTFLVAI
jgi:DNA-directed RNA polymerase subunit RPC12/RpoP